MTAMLHRIVGGWVLCHCVVGCLSSTTAVLKLLQEAAGGLALFDVEAVLDIYFTRVELRDVF